MTTHVMALLGASASRASSAGRSKPGAAKGIGSLIVEPTIDHIRASRLLPVIRTADSDEALDVVTRLGAAGLDIVELTTTIPDWPAAVSRVRERHPEVSVGLGTVLHTEDAERALELGVQFLVSPRLVPSVRDLARSADVPFIEGGLTPTEVMTALADGNPAKLFPAHVGGPQYLRTLLSVAPGASIIPTGGIRLPDVAAWLDAGAFAVGVGRDLLAADDLAAQVRALRA